MVGDTAKETERLPRRHQNDLAGEAAWRLNQIGEAELAEKADTTLSATKSREGDRRQVSRVSP